jgi:membrane-associated protease RseP (regulator of RpoE activity)
VVWDGKEERGSEFVVVFEVVGGSLAASSGVREGDVIVRVNNVKVHSVTQVQKTINKTRHGSILLTVKRPPKHISSHMLQSGNSHRATPTSQRTPSGVSSDVEGEEGVAKEDGDSISLRGVGGERALSSGESQELLGCTVQVVNGNGVGEGASFEPSLGSSHPQFVPSHLWVCVESAIRRILIKRFHCVPVLRW